MDAVPASPIWRTVARTDSGDSVPLYVTTGNVGPVRAGIPSPARPIAPAIRPTDGGGRRLPVPVDDDPAAPSRIHPDGQGRAGLHLVTARAGRDLADLGLVRRLARQRHAQHELVDRRDPVVVLVRRADAERGLLAGDHGRLAGQSDLVDAVRPQAAGEQPRAGRSEHERAAAGERLPQTG
jgi:hypothetical protein